MTYTVRLPALDGDQFETLDILDGTSSAVQRELRRHGMAGYEPPTSAVLLALWSRSRPGFVFFDIGANIGLYAAVCASVAHPGHVVAFEPTPSTAAIARRLMRANALAVAVEQVAIGDRHGFARLYLSARSDSSNSLVEGFKADVGTIEVEVETLDRYVERTGLVPDVVKVDTETFETEVITGARQVLTEHRPHLVVEVLNRRGHDHGAEVTSAMAGMGYCYYRIDAHRLQPASAISGQPGSRHNDWLLAPAPLPEGFSVDVAAWAEALTRCAATTNGRLPLLPTIVTVYKADGLTGLVRGLRNRSRRLRTGRRSTG